MAERNYDNRQYTAADIEKYWKGALTPAEMHAMEKAALEDPFLADAMEGFAPYAHEAGVMKEDLADLHKQLKERSSPRRTKVISIRWWQATAAAILLIAAGSGVYYLLSSDRGDRLATSRTTEAAKETPAAGAGEAATAGPADTQPATTQPANNQPSTTQPANKLPAADKPSAIEPGSTDPARTDPARPAAEPARKAPTLISTETARNAGDINTTTRAASESVAAPTATQPLPAAAPARKEVPARIIRGVVTDEKEQPVAGAIVSLLQNRTAGVTVTDSSGRFRLPVTDSTLQLQVASTGYYTREMELNKAATDTDIRVRLQASPALDEVVVQGYGSRRKRAVKTTSAPIAIAPNADTSLQQADPVGGWQAFFSYLEVQKQVPDSLQTTNGAVTLSFRLKKDGVPTEISILTGLQPQLDREAIRLVQEGPRWRLKKGKQPLVTVRVAF